MKLLNDIFLTFFNKIILLVIGIALASATAWILGPEGRGELSIGIVFGTILVLILGFGAEMGCTYYAGNSKQPINNILGTQIFAFLITSLLIVGVGIGILNSSLSFVKKLPEIVYEISIIYGIAYLLFMYLSVMFMGMGRLLEYNIALTLEQLMIFILIIILCVKFPTSENAMVAYVIGTFIAAGWLLFKLVKTKSVQKITFSWLTIKACYRYGMKYYFAKLATLTNVQMGVIIISFFGTVTQAGLFSAGLGLISRMWIIPDTFNTVLLSRVLKDEVDVSGTVTKACRSTIIVMLIGSLLLILTIKPLVRIILSPDFLPVVVPIIILIPGVIMRSYSKIIASFFNGSGRPELNSIILFVSLILNLTLMVIFLPLWDISGAASATSMAYIVEGLLAIIFFCKISKLSWKQLIPGIADIRLANELISQKLMHMQNVRRKVS